ncbi:MAG: nucleotidyltransferase domain-containing protein [bacterium]
MQLTGKERKILEVFKRQAQARFPGLISDVIVHGSKARGDATGFSGIDVLVESGNRR